MREIEPSDKIKVYVSGPYTKGDPVINTRNAIEAGNAVLAYGHVPIIPHLTMFWHFMTPKPWDKWIEYDLELLDLCDIILRLPGDSVGADREMEHARKLGLCRVHTVEEALRTIDVLYRRGGY